MKEEEFSKKNIERMKNISITLYDLNESIDELEEDMYSCGEPELRKPKDVLSLVKNVVGIGRFSADNIMARYDDVLKYDFDKDGKLIDDEKKKFKGV